MKDVTQQVDRSYKMSARVTEVFQDRVARAQERFRERIRTLLGGGGVSRKRVPRVKKS